MAAPIMKICTTTSDRIPDLPVKNGQMIFVRDVRKICMDLNDIRVTYEDIVVYQTDGDRVADSNAATGFYYVEQTHVMWRRNSLGWTQITPDNLNPIVIASFDKFPKVGDPSSLYVDDDVLYKWDMVSESYLPVANLTKWDNIDL